jgi:hypothetical protein
MDLSGGERIRLSAAGAVSSSSLISAKAGAAARLRVSPVADLLRTDCADVRDELVDRLPYVSIVFGALFSPSSWRANDAWDTRRAFATRR